jgi:hypothetical protein
MKKLMLNFAQNLLSKEKMKSIKGGGSYSISCYCDGVPAGSVSCNEMEECIWHCKWLCKH